MIKWKGFGRKQSWPNLDTVEHLLEGLRKTTTNLFRIADAPA
jgi:hypothetical protein